MTFLVGQTVKCISPGPSGKITEGQLYIVTGTRVDEDGDSFVFVNGVSREFFASRFEAMGLSTSPDVPPDMPLPKPKAPAIVLNAEAKGKAKPKVDDTQWIPHVTSHGQIPEDSVPCTHEQYIENPTLVALSPVWVTIKSHIPQKHREYVYDALKIAFGSLDTMSLRPRATRVIDVFTWSSTPQRSMWHYLNEALNTGNWSKFNDYVESSSTA
jgi:hypothetical protein